LTWHALHRDNTLYILSLLTKFVTRKLYINSEDITGNSGKYDKGVDGYTTLPVLLSWTNEFVPLSYWRPRLEDLWRSGKTAPKIITL